MTTFRDWIVFRRSVTHSGLSIEREFAWWIELEDGLPIGRRVIDTYTGEIVDEVLLDATGRVRSYAIPRAVRGRQSSDAPDGSDSRLVEAVVAASTRTDDQVIEHGGDDGSLPSEGQVRPQLPQSGRVADVTLNDRDAA